MIVDTSVLFAFFDNGDREHERVRPVVLEAGEPLILSPYVVAELDYLATTRLGTRAEIGALRDLITGAWELADFDLDDLRSAVSVIEKYADQNIGLADASMVVLADRYGTRTIGTLDRRHFGAVRPLSGGRFRIVP